VVASAGHFFGIIKNRPLPASASTRSASAMDKMLRRFRKQFRSDRFQIISKNSCHKNESSERTSPNYFGRNGVIKNRPIRLSKIESPKKVLSDHPLFRIRAFTHPFARNALVTAPVGIARSGLTTLAADQHGVGHDELTDCNKAFGVTSSLR
jgi:hypothetical protein